MNIYTCQDIANYFLRKANETGSFISNLKLQKLIYYAQAWNLANYGEPLFSEDFQAWVHGPVIYKLWKKYNSFGFTPIKEEPKCIEFDDRTQELLDGVADAYMPYDGYELELMSHKEDPWIKAREGFAPDQPCNKIISKESMRVYFKKLITNEN